MAGRFLDVWVNCPDRDTAVRIAEACIEGRLAACANILPAVASIYRWKGAVERSGEVPLLMKTRSTVFDQLAALVRDNHPYEVPSIVATELTHVEASYADGLDEETWEPRQA